jgi:hypothetical protein
MERLAFEGSVVNGQGDHSKLVVPGRSLLSDAPEDWPETLRPGSLNVRISVYPPAWHERGLSASVKVLDTGVFPPEFLIPQGRMHNNRLTPTPSKPRRGIGQVWRATLNANGGCLDCWVLRRIDSGLRDVLELVAGCAIRPALGLELTKDWPATVTAYGHWRA